MIQPLVFGTPKIETWECPPEYVLFRNTKNLIIGPISSTLGITSETLDFFVIRPKKCYNSQVIRDHICQVVNYFEAFYDKDKEYLVSVARIKYMIDVLPVYTKENFIHDVGCYILGPSIKQKVMKMTDDNYTLDLTYKNISAPLQYTNDHAKYLMMMSILMNLVIPLTTHFAYKNRVDEIDDFILDVYDIILYMFPVDMFSKLYETSISNVAKSEYKNAPLWVKQDIRGKNVVTHSNDNVNNIMLNIMPKYVFDRNVVALNYTSIQRNTKCQITDIEYEFNFVSLSSSKRDGEDNISDYDKHEANMIKNNEALYLQCRVSSRETVKLIEQQFGPFSDEDIEFYRNHLKNSNGNYMNPFQRQLIFNLFYKYFGDTESVYAIQPSTDYIKLMLAAKKLLLQNNTIIMPYVISSKVEKLVPRKTINKKEEKDLKASPYYPMLVKKYRNERIIQNILGQFATVISSTFRIIEPHDPNLHGKIIDTIPAIVLEELQLMCLLY